MSDYRFLVRDVMTRATWELTLVCPTDDDALLVGARLAMGHDLEVWDGARRVSDAFPDAETQAEIGEPPLDLPDALPLAAEPAPAAPVMTEVDLEAERARPFNPFRPTAWRRLRPTA